MAIWLTSDLHLGHDREFIWGARGFKSIDEMNTAIINRWNSTVNEDDDIYVLGDLALGDKTNIDLIKQLKGKIHIVLGNHDISSREKLYRQLPNVVEVELALRIKYNGYHFFLTHYPCMTGNLENESLKQMTLNLYGHTHQTNNFYEDRPYMYHVGCDSHDCYPILLDSIIKEMNNKVNECKSYLDIGEDEIAVYADKFNNIIENIAAEMEKDPEIIKMLEILNSLGNSESYGGNCSECGKYSD